MERLSERAQPHVGDAYDVAPFDTAKGRREREEDERYRSDYFRREFRRLVFALPDIDMRREILVAHGALHEHIVKEARADLDAARAALRVKPDEGLILAIVNAAAMAVPTHGAWLLGGPIWGITVGVFVLATMIGCLPMTLTRYASGRASIQAEVVEHERSLERIVEQRIFSRYEHDTGKSLETTADV